MFPTPGADGCFWKMVGHLQFWSILCGQFTRYSSGVWSLSLQYHNIKVKVKQSHYRPGRPWGFQEVEAPRFQDNRHMKVVRLSTPRTGCLYPQEIFLVLICVSGWVDPGAIVQPEGLCQWKIAMTPSGIEPATFRLVAECLNQLRHRMPYHNI